MREVRVESLDGLERREGQVRLSANGGAVRLVFPETLWEDLLKDASGPEGPTAVELAELDAIRDRLERYAGENSFRTIRRDVGCDGEGRGPAYDLVLEASGLLAATTGYLFAPVVGAELMARVGVGLDEDRSVEQAYLIGGIADDAALAAGDDALRALSIRGRRCSCSRFEMPPELWRVLSGGLGWRDVETYVGTSGKEER